MVRIAIRIASRKFGSGVGASTTAAGTALGSGPSIGTTSTSNNVLINRPGPSINQLSSPSGIHTVASASTGSESASSSTNYKLSIASMLLAMKNQALGSLSLGGSKAGGSITENYSGVNLG